MGRVWSTVSEVLIGSALAAHALHLAIALVLFTGVAFAGRRHSPPRERDPATTKAPPATIGTTAAVRSPSAPPPGLHLATGASLSAGLVHVAVCPQHFREATVFGVFFLVAALLQVGWAAATARGLVAPSTRWLSAAVVLSA